jgi:hypothetical protein
MRSDAKRSVAARGGAVSRVAMRGGAKRCDEPRCRTGRRAALLSIAKLTLFFGGAATPERW